MRTARLDFTMHKTCQMRKLPNLMACAAEHNIQFLQSEFLQVCNMINSRTYIDVFRLTQDVGINFVLHRQRELILQCAGCGNWFCNVQAVRSDNLCTKISNLAGCELRNQFSLPVQHEINSQAEINFRGTAQSEINSHIFEHC